MNRLSCDSIDSIDHDSGSKKFQWMGFIPFLGIHLMCLWVFQAGISLELVALGTVSYYLRMFAITAGYHRYFSHRSYKTSRWFQFVLAFGTRANTDLVPGLAEHALPLKLIGDAMFIRNRVLQRIARIELETDPVLRRRLGHFVVIGGGFSGVEVAGTLADFLRSARRYYPRVATDELRVSLLEGAERLLLELPESLAASALRSRSSRGIDVRLKARAAKVDANGVRLEDGGALDAATVVCTIGTKPNPLAAQLGLVLQRGRIVTAPDLSVPGGQGVWAIGDCALIRNEPPRSDSGAVTAASASSLAYAPPTAQFAVAEARFLAANIAARVAGRPTREFRYVSKGAMATTGHLKGVAQLSGVRLSGLPAWLLWRAYYLLQMPTLGRKLRIWVEWTWAMFFAADITHLRFTRTHEADASPPHEALAPAVR
jgi:NADH dehydrogenase